jgi:aspartate carbamoyltransferase catalytic subunit
VGAREAWRFPPKKESKEMLKRLAWDEFSSLEVSDKIPYLSRDEKGERLFHVLFAQQFSRKMLDDLCSLADDIRAMHKKPEGAVFLGTLLRDRHALNLFAQPSTRTFMSFQVAELNLGMMTTDIRDVSTSSQAKGETLQNSIRTFSSYVDLIVMRHPEKGACEQAAWEMNMAERRVPILNGGSGADQHPTQALLDIYTIWKSLGEIEGKTVVMAGDLARGRTVRSLSYLLRNYPGVRILYVAPEHLRVGADIRAFLKRHNVAYEEVDNLADVVEKADAIYMTRIQWEWDVKKDATAGAPVQRGQYDPRFVFKKEYLARMKPKSCLMHPLPKVNEIDTELDYADDPRVVYWRQERNGMWVRAALIAHVMEVDDKITKYSHGR